MFKAICNVISNIRRPSHPVAGTSAESIGSDNQGVVSTPGSNASILHRLPSDDRQHVLRVVQDYFERNDLGKEVLNNIHEDNGLTYSKLSRAVIAYFKKGDDVSFDRTNQLLTAILSVKGVGSETVLESLVSAAMAYFIDSDAVVSDKITQAFMQAFLRLKDTDLSGEYKQESFQQLIGDALWRIYSGACRNKNPSYSARWLMIDANLQYDQWRESNFISLTMLTENYCSINKPDLEKLTALIDVIKDKSSDDPGKRFEVIFTEVATEYFVRNASDVSVARLLIDAVVGLFEKGEVYNKHAYFGGDDVVFCELPERIKLQDTLICCVNWFFYEDYYFSDKESHYYLPEELDGRKTPRVLSELIASLWEKAKGVYDVVELAQSIYQTDSDARRQLCLVESLILLEENTTRHLLATINVSSLIDGVLGFYSEKIKDCPERVHSLLSLVSAGGYSDRCKRYVKKHIERFYFPAMSNSATGIAAQETGAIEKRYANILDCLAPDERFHVLRVIQGYLAQSESKKGLLDTINTRHELTCSELSAVVNAWFVTGDAGSFDVSNQLLNAVLSAEGMSAETVLGILASAATAYFVDSGTAVNDEVTLAFMQAFLRLKDTESSKGFKQLSGDVLWGIYCTVRSNKNFSRDARWLMIDTNLQFSRWRGETSFIKLTAMAQNYCSINKSDPERLTALIDVIKHDLDNNDKQKFRAVFINVAAEYFAGNASDASVARLIIDAVVWLFERGEKYYRDAFFYWEEVVFRDLPDNIKLRDALACCVNWFFHEDKDYAQNAITYYLPEEQGGRKTPRVLSELIAALWEKGGRNYDVVKLARSVYQTNSDARRQLCLVESLILLEEQKNQHFPAAIDLPTVINSVLDVYLKTIKTDPEEIHNLLSLVSAQTYSERCKEYVTNSVERSHVSRI